ncbi:MAG: hypothetical protein QGG25_17145, partial [Phycisphaerae bacterium]|nr:hypothetical protein [Phycisphaerae bacterium]
MPDIPSRLCSDCGTVIEPMPDDRLCPKCGHKFPDKHTEDIERLTEILQANPGQCPACGCEHIRKITEGKAVVGDRICMKCQCLWSPQWSKSSGYLAAIMGFAIAVPAIGIA